MAFIDEEEDGVNSVDPLITDGGKKPRIKQFVQRKLCSDLVGAKYLRCNKHDI